MDELKIYSRKELCELLGCCTKLVDDLIDKGELHSIKLGERRIGIPAWSVRAWQEKHANRV